MRRHMRHNFPITDQIELIVTSPLRRCIQTATYALSWLVQRNVPVLSRPEWQENSDKPCDTGSDRSILEKEFKNVDFSTMDQVFPAKAGPYAYTKAAIIRRGLEARGWLSQRPEKVIAVVSHGAFLRTSIAHAWFMNADYRIFDFIDEEGGPDINEWALTLTRGGAMGRSYKDRPWTRQDDFRELDEYESAVSDQPM